MGCLGVATLWGLVDRYTAVSGQHGGRGVVRAPSPVRDPRRARAGYPPARRPPPTYGERPRRPVPSGDRGQGGLPPGTREPGGPPPGRRRPPASRSRYRRRRALALLLVVALLGGVAVALSKASGAPGAPQTPVRARMVSLAQSQLGYHSTPPSSYCNRFSAFWGVGTATTCGPGLRSEEWCADFAAWVWHEAGARMTYAFTTGDINGAAASFYVWAVDHGRWHPAGSSYVPQPGDVAVYGLNATTDVASHVAVVVGYTPGERGPNVVNGDGDRTGFSVVEAGTDQYHADVPGKAGVLSGYASPIIPRPRTTTTSG